MEGAIRRFPFLADAEAIRLVCHPDAMTPDANPLIGPAPRRSRLLGGRRPVAQRVRRRRRDRPGAGRLDDGGRPGRRRRAVPGVAICRRVSRPGPSRPAWRARPTPTTTGCATRSMPMSPAGRVACPRSTAGSRRQAPYSGRRRAGSEPTTSRPAGRGVAPDAIRPRSAGRDHHGSIALRTRPGRCASEPGSSTCSSFGKIASRDPERSASSSGSAANDVDRPVGSVVYTPVLRRARRNGGGRDRHAPGGRSLPGRHRGRVSRIGHGLARDTRGPGRSSRPRSATSAGSSRPSASGGHGPGTSWRRRPRRT